MKIIKGIFMAIIFLTASSCGIKGPPLPPQEESAYKMNNMELTAGSASGDPTLPTPNKSKKQKK